MTHSLRQTPSLNNNNLSCYGTYLSYAKGSDVIVANFGDNKLMTGEFMEGERGSIVEENVCVT